MPRPAAVRVRVEFSREHDNYLVKYLATYCPTKEGRSGRKVFERLVDNEQKQWPWSVHHTWQSWRERYVKNSAHFDALILSYQRKRNINIKSVDKRKHAAEPVPIEMLRPSAKRVRLEKEEESPSRHVHVPCGSDDVGLTKPGSEKRATTQHENASSSRPKPTSKSMPKQLPETPSQAPNPTHEPEPTNAPHTAPAASPPRSKANASASANKEPTPDLTALQTRPDTLKILPSSPDRQAPSPTDGNPELRIPPRHVKRIKVRPRTPSDVFASDPSSPRGDAVSVIDVGGPASQTQPAPSAPSTGADGALVATSVYPRAPPRVVDSFHGQVLVDREGRVPRALPHGDEDGAEIEEEEDKSRWPPARGPTAKQRRTSGPDIEVDAHHPFNQLPLQPQLKAPRESVAMGERERGKPNQPLERISRTLDGAILDRRNVAARFSDHSVESERREDMVRDGPFPVKRVVTTTPPSDPFSGVIPKPLSKVLKFPVPRASTRSPFRPGSPTEETRHPPPQPQRRSHERTRAARYPALTRIRRQTIGHGNGNGHEHEHRREHGQVPSVDLVALSHSSLSARSHSRSSAGASVPERPSRWSLPGFAHATPWVFDEPNRASVAPGSADSESLFRWTAPSAVYGDIWRARTSSFVGTSTPRSMFTPSPARSVAGNGHGNGSTPRTNGIPAFPSVTLAPHPPDLHLTATHGLASILARMSANHGLAPGVVEAVYARVGSLRDADEVLRGMREAAEGFGEREIERRLRGRRGSRLGREEKAGEARGSGDGDGQLRYVVASEDGEGSEYSPPETSRAAMWKRQAESVGCAEEGEGEEEEEEAEEGRAVEEELRDRDEHEDDGENGPHHDFSRHVSPAEGKDEDDAHDVQHPRDDAWEEQSVMEALVDDMRFAQEQERKMGKARYRRNIVRLFV